MTIKKRSNKNRAPTGYTPPPKRKIASSSSSSPSSAKICHQSDYYFVSCMNCKQTFIYELSTEMNTNHCFTPVFDHSKVNCKLDCSFKSINNSCSYVSSSTLLNPNEESDNPTPVDSPTTSRPNSPNLSIVNTCETSNVTFNLIGDTNMNTNPNINLDQDIEMIDGNQSITTIPNSTLVTPNVTPNSDTNLTDSTTANTNINQDSDIIMHDPNRAVLQDQQNKKTFAQTVTSKENNRSTDKPDLPLFSTIIPLNESLPHTFPTNNKYFHSFYNYVLTGIRAFRPGLSTFDKTINTLSNNLPDQLITEWKEDIDLKLFALQSAKRKFVIKNMRNLLDYIFTKLNYVKFFATKIPPSPHNDRLNVFRNCARFYLYLLNKYVPFSLGDLINKFKPITPSITLNFTVNPREKYNKNNQYISSVVHANLRTDIFFNLPPLEEMEFNTPSLKNSKASFDSWFETKFYPCYQIHHPSTPKEKVLGFLRSRIYEEFHKRYFEIVTTPPSWDRYKINSLKTRQYAVRQMANWHIKFHKPKEGFETLCDLYWKQSFDKFPVPETCTHCGVSLNMKKTEHGNTCPIFQSTLILPTIDFSSINTNLSEPFPTTKLREAVNLAVGSIDFNLYSSHNKQKITDLLFHTNKRILIDSILKDFIPNFDHDQDYREILNDHLKSLKTPPPRSTIFNYCQATLGTDYAMTHTDDIILQSFAPTFNSLLESFNPFQDVTPMEITK